MYLVKCGVCSALSDIFLKMSDYDNLPICACGGFTTRAICAPAIQASFTEYISPGTGKLIQSRNQQREDFKVSNSIMNEPGVAADIARNKLEAAEKAFAPIASGIDDTIRHLSTAGQLEN